MAEAKRDQNRVTTILGTSNVDDITPVNVGADPVTKRLLTHSTGDTSGKTQFTGDVSISKSVVGNVTTYTKTGVTNDGHTTQTITLNSSTGAITKAWT